MHSILPVLVEVYDENSAQGPLHAQHDSIIYGGWNPPPPTLQHCNMHCQSPTPLGSIMSAISVHCVRTKCGTVYVGGKEGYRKGEGDEMVLNVSFKGYL